MSEILSPSAIDDLFDRLLNTTDDWLGDVQMCLSHDAALRARVAELEAALREIRDEPIHHGYSDHAALVTQLQRWARAALAAKEERP